MQESILVFKKGKFDYNYTKRMSSEVREASRIDPEEYNRNEWNLTVWKITNVFPKEGRLEEGIAAFPEEIPRRLIKLFSYVGETVLDPFLGSGTTSKVAMQLRRNSVGYELDIGLQRAIMRKLSSKNTKLELVQRKDSKNLKSFIKGSKKAEVWYRGEKAAIITNLRLASQLFQDLFRPCKFYGLLAYHSGSDLFDFITFGPCRYCNIHGM